MRKKVLNDFKVEVLEKRLEMRKWQIFPEPCAGLDCGQEEELF